MSTKVYKWYIALAIIGVVSNLILGEYGASIALAAFGVAMCLAKGKQEKAEKSERAYEIAKEKFNRLSKFCDDLDDLLLITSMEKQFTEKILKKKTYETEYLRGAMSEDAYMKKAFAIKDECDELYARIVKFKHEKYF